MKSARLVAQPKQQQYQPLVPIGQQLAPLRYDIRTVHDADYKVYKPEENEQGEEILAALKKNPTVASYFKPAQTNVEVSHPLKYRSEDVNSDENIEVQQNYKPNNAYISGAPRVRRYTSGRQRQNLKKHHSEEEEEDDPYIYKPKAFNSPLYSAYTEEKEPNKDYEYPYGDYDSGYDHKAYERIKDLSEKQAAEIKQNPGNCKEVKRDGMTCNVCKDPKTGGNYESCSYVAEPKNNKYAYSKERKFDSNDQPNESEDEKSAQKPAKYQSDDKTENDKYSKLSSAESAKPYDSYKDGSKEDDDSKEKYKAYYVHSSKPTPSEALRASDESKNPDDETESVVQPYNYKKALPGFYTDNEPKKDVEHVLAEFKKKDRSSCKRVQKNGMTCFQCIDKSGLKNEECMYVSESAPKLSHLAYQEVKEFTSKPTTLDRENDGAASQTVTTSAPLHKSAAYVVDTNTYGKKLKRKKAVQTAASKPVAAVVPAVKPLSVQPINVLKVKRSVDSEGEKNAEIKDETNVAAPEEFAGDSSKGAFWAETMPRYSAALGVTLPEYMLSRSEHELSFDETVAGA